MFNQNCAGDQNKWDGVCSTSVWEELSKATSRTIIGNIIKKCVFDSGGLGGQTNVHFDSEINLFSEYGIEWVPTVTINNEKYRGTFLCPNPVEIGTCSIFAAICGAFAPETIPQACVEQREIGCASGETRDVCGVCGGDGTSCTRSETKSVAIGFIIIIVLIFFLTFAIVIYFVRRVSSAEEQFEALRNMYEPLQDVDHNEMEATVLA